MNYRELENLARERKLEVIAAKIGTTGETLRNNFRNKNMKVSTYEALCEILGKSPCYFFEDGSNHVADNRTEYVVNENKLLQKIADLQSTIIELQRKMK